jgi:conflict system pore-forming effector with SLATT domain
MAEPAGDGGEPARGSGDDPGREPAAPVGRPAGTDPAAASANEIRVGRQQLPALARAASNASGRAQRLFLWLVGADLALLVLAGVSGAVEWTGQAEQAAAFATAAFMAFGLVLALVIQQERLERTWYDGRAVAESVKTIAWRYMTKTKPYQGETVDKRFIADLRKIMNERRELAAALRGDVSADPITPTMERVRSFDTAGRLKVYLRERIGDQQRFYSERANENQDRQRRWFLAVVGLQAAGLIAAVVEAARPESRFSPAGIFATAAAAGLAWIQLKRHRELAQAYRLAAHELSLICAEAGRVGTDAELSAFVADAENAISREHTMWVARRDQS